LSGAGALAALVPAGVLIAAAPVLLLVWIAEAIAAWLLGAGPVSSS
jgi:hypothetical protein